ncbi:DUF1919 domain-containing protein [Kovacikia minuta CCNUW1]|uniref:DUF1919 domain-containing protein n=1 Tax=Kovacikia minuta TaxID=2931930 RepID=UPI001CCBDADC|nr:DUF1919 domain-containing protein [Kovacikia minuta]UBF27339.1 DUF1919 domain-containing protein [Kovacikia minuta CCNUW1]
MSIKTTLKTYRNQFVKTLVRSQLRNKNFTIISNNCWGGEVYREFGLPYQTPFVGLFLFAPCYIQLLQNPRTYLEQTLRFITCSKYQPANEARKQGIWDLYPIGLLGDAIEIHFMHYASETEAREKWIRRSQRINWNNQDRIFFKFCDRELCTNQLLIEFDQLKYAHKVCFTSQPHPTLRSAVWIEECKQDESVVDGGELYRIGKKYFDVIDWLNGGSGQIKLTRSASCPPTF